MICRGCPDNKILSDREATRKDTEGEYLDLCEECVNAMMFDDLGFVSTGAEEEVGPIFLDSEDLPAFENFHPLTGESYD